MSPKEVSRIGRWVIYVAVDNGSGDVWLCDRMGCDGSWYHGREFGHRGAVYDFAVNPTRFLFWKSRGVSEAVGSATNEALRRHQQDLADAGAREVAEEIAQEISGMIRERLEAV